MIIMVIILIVNLSGRWVSVGETRGEQRSMNVGNIGLRFRDDYF